MEEIGSIAIPEDGRIVILSSEDEPEPGMKEIKGFSAILSNHNELYLSWRGHGSVPIAGVKMYLVHDPEEPAEEEYASDVDSGVSTEGQAADDRGEGGLGGVLQSAGC